MGLFASLFTGVSALSAQSQATSMISNNIANVNTTGFKRSEASFFSLVTSEGRSTRYSPGTVSTNRLQQVNQQGGLFQTSSSTDAAISGNGFFAIKRDAEDSSLSEFLYTRNGQFSEDSQGLLRNSAGFFLYGWPLDSEGNLPSSQGDLTSLVPINVGFLGGLTRPTNTGQLGINLDAGEVDTLLTTALTSAPDFSRGLTVYDTLGEGHSVSFQYTKVYGPQGTAAGTIGDLTTLTELTTTLGITDGQRFTISIDGGAVRTYEIDSNPSNGTTAGADVYVQTIGDILSDINDNVAGASAYIGNDGELIIQRDSFIAGTESITLANVGAGTSLTGMGLTAGTYTSNNLASATYDNGSPTDVPPYSGEKFPAFQYLPGDPQYNPRGWWQVNVVLPDGTSAGRGLINFSGDGSINALPDSDGNVDIELSAINWGNGSELQDITIDIERLSQFSSDYNVLFSDQDGAELGLRTGIAIDRDGFVIARFSNGASTQLYKLPLVTFSNANGLQEVSGTAYTKSEQSGEENLREARTGGAGFLESSTLENSNVDLADEFARLIVGQRAFSAGTKIINTIDQMTEELLRLR
jgi:flagellar hook-basal body protein